MRKWLVFLILPGLMACEKDIEFNLDESAPTLVVDASIENDLAPQVVLTKSLSFFQQINPTILEDAFVHDAEVYMSNGTVTHKLKEQAIPLVAGYNAYVYTIDSSDLATAFVGELNHAYSLRIVTGGKEYLSSTFIPALNVVPDSVYYKQAPFIEDTTLRIMMVKASDPPGLGNYIRYLTKRNSGPFLPGENSVYTDEVIDGTTYDVTFPQGIDRNDPPKADSNFYHKGDTVTFKFSNISKSTYQFWNTWEFAFQSIGNPFAQPNKVIGNVNNGALGAFCGYAAWYNTQIVP
jgi:hypothetical protein